MTPVQFVERRALADHDGAGVRNRGFDQDAAGRNEAGQLAGQLEARRDTLLRLLARAGIALTEDDGRRIQACTDTVVLDRWIDNVFGATSVAGVLTPAP